MANEISDEVAELLIRMAVDPAFAEQYRSSVAFRNAEHTRRKLNVYDIDELRRMGSFSIRVSLRGKVGKTTAYEIQQMTHTGDVTLATKVQ